MPDLSDAASVWQAVLGRLQLEMPREHFNTFLRPCVGHNWEEGSLVVAAASSFAVSWLELPLHLAMAQEALTRTLGREAGVRYRALPAVAQSGSLPDEGDGDGRAGVGVPAVSAGPAGRRAPVPEDYDLGRGNAGAGGGGYDWSGVNAATGNPRYTFENFVVGTSNQLAYHAARAVAESDGGAPGGYNPLLLYSASGLGKTHLLHAIGNRAWQQNRAALYVTSEQFTNEFVSAVNRRGMREFRDRYRSLDLLLLDDAQFFAGKERTQESLFHTFNDLHQAGAQIVLTSDRPPQSIAPLQDRLRSRFQWGLMADIQPPAEATRLAMLHAWAAGRGAQIPDAALEVIARRAKDNVRQLQGAFNRIAAMLEMRKGTPDGGDISLDLDDVGRQLDAIAGPDRRREVSAAEMLGQVARQCRIAEEQILGRGRTAAVAQARQVAMYLLTGELGMTPTDAGRFLGGRSHSTVLHGAGKVGDAMAKDEGLRQSVDSIKAALFG